MIGIESGKRIQNISRNYLGKQRGYTETAKPIIKNYFKQSILHAYLRFMFEPIIKATYKKRKKP